jgi:pilus assembly protein Flp/PilA
MKSIKMIAKQFVKDESGQDLIEYALIAALISTACVASLGTLAGSIGGAFNTVGNSM